MATIHRVLERNAIPGADAIESVKVLGWNCVTKKEEFQVGDLCIYFTLGTVFPTDYERTSFLNGKPLKTKRLRGSLSQGLVAPLLWVTDFGHQMDSFKEGDDVTEMFNIKKFVEAEESEVYRTAFCPNKHAMAAFPSYVPKTDEERIQNIPHILPHLIGKEIVITRKEDGCSATYIARNGEFIMCSRNFIVTEMDKGNQHLFRIAEGLQLKDKLLALNRNLAFQGEIVGPKISANRLKLPGLAYRVFNVFDLDDETYLSHSEVMTLCNELGIETVPVLFHKTVTEEEEIFASVDALLAFADTVSYGPGIQAEGIVVKANYRYPRVCPRVTRDDLPAEVYERRISFKAISNNYLLQFKL